MSRWIQSGVIAFLMGIVLGSAGSGASVIVIVSISVAAFTFAVTRSIKYTMWITCICVCGVIRFILSEPTIDEYDIAYYHEMPVTVRGVVDSEPDERLDHVKLTVEIESISLLDNWRPIGGKVLINVHRYPAFSYRDIVEITGVMSAPREDISFSYKDYLSMFDIDTVMYYPHVILIESSSGLTFFDIIYGLKTAIQDRINRLFPEPFASFASGLLLGARKGIPTSLLDDFQITGLTHIIAISGFNITILIVFIAGLFRTCSRRTQIILSTAVIIDDQPWTRCPL